MFRPCSSGAEQPECGTGVSGGSSPPRVSRRLVLREVTREGQIAHFVALLDAYVQDRIVLAVDGGMTEAEVIKGEERVHELKQSMIHALELLL